MINVIDPKLEVNVDAKHSCNWRCCWGCKKDGTIRVIERKTQSLNRISSQSEIDVTVTATFHKSHGNHENN